MEHKLITGGEQWLPFARSRIKAIRAAGLRHASQKFVMPDGALVKVRVVADQEYIEIVGDGASLPLDNGAVKISDEPFGEGVLHETGAVQGYQAAFSGSEGDEFRRNKGGGNDAQIAGKLRLAGGRLRGEVPYDSRRAKSFSPKQIPDPEDEKKTIDDPEDYALMSKTMTAISVPASIFTGRCRLYVQAMYGAWMYPSKDEVVKFPSSVHGNYAAPYLLLDHFVRKNSNEDYPQKIQLTTSSGVYFDPITGGHWLVIPPNQGTTVVLYPLISIPAGERLRRFLRGDSKIALSQGAREKLEAYVLSRALPDRKNPIYLVTSGIKFQPASMGYGWHFNWSGTEATYVHLEQESQGLTPGGPAYEVKSTTCTLNLNVSHGEDNSVVFSASVTQGGPERFSAPVNLVSISGPEFKLLNQDKILPRVSIKKETTAVFYAYYKRDELVKCSISVKRVEPREDTFSGSKYASGVTYSEVGTIGLEGGYGEYESNPGYWEYTVTAGDVKAGPVKTAHAKVFRRFEVDILGAEPPEFVPFNVRGDANIPVGYPISIDPLAWQTVYFSGNLGYHGVPWMTTIATQETVREKTYSYALVAFAPALDAEAFFACTTTSVLDVRTGTRKTYEPLPGWVYDYWAREGFSGWEEPFQKFTYYNWGHSLAGAVVSAEDIIDDRTVAPSFTGTLAAGGASSEGEINIDPYFADAKESEVSSWNSCISGVASPPIVAAPSMEVVLGTGSAPDRKIVVVGWA